MYSNKYTNFSFVWFFIYFFPSNEWNKIFFKHFSFTLRNINYAIIPCDVENWTHLEYFALAFSSWSISLFVTLVAILIKITNDLVKILRNRAIPSSRFFPLSSAYDSKGRELPLPLSFFVVSFFFFFFIRHPFKIPPPFFSSFASKKKQYPADQLDKVSRISEWIISRQRIPFAPHELVK